MRLAVLMAVCLALTACATKVVSSSARTVVISGPDGAVAEAQKLADAECQRHSRHARLIARPHATSDQFVFDCVQ
jgi:hypothetical protein